MLAAKRASLKENYDGKGSSSEQPRNQEAEKAEAKGRRVRSLARENCDSAKKEIAGEIARWRRQACRNPSKPIVQNRPSVSGGRRLSRPCGLARRPRPTTCTSPSCNRIPRHKPTAPRR